MAATACDFVLVHELDADCLVRAVRLAAEVALHERATEQRRLEDDASAHRIRRETT